MGCSYENVANVDNNHLVGSYTSRKNVNAVNKKFSLIGVRRPAGGAWDAPMKTSQMVSTIIRLAAYGLA